MLVHNLLYFFQVDLIIRVILESSHWNFSHSFEMWLHPESKVKRNKSEVKRIGNFLGCNWPSSLEHTHFKD